MNCFLICFLAVPKFAFCDEDIAVFDADEDVRLSIAVECFARGRSFIVAVELKKDVVSDALFIEGCEGGNFGLPPVFWSTSNGRPLGRAKYKHVFASVYSD